MFGMHYQRRDDDVAGRGKAQACPDTQGAFARAVLAQVLNRAVALELAYRHVYETEGDPISPGDHQEALETLARIVDTFLEDVEEARTRGLRARLFCRTGTGNDTSDSVDSQDDLQDLGGELVSADRALNLGD